MFNNLCIFPGMRIGILSDTHLPNVIRDLDELGPEPAEFFASVDLILHSGDLTSPMVLDWLEQFAPVACTIGNNDPIIDTRCKEIEIFDFHGWRLGMIHSLQRGFRPVAELQQLFPAPVDIMVAGDTHQERLEYRDGALLTSGRNQVRVVLLGERSFDRVLSGLLGLVLAD